MSARDYAVLYVGGKVTRGGSVGGAAILGGDAVLDAEQHALAGPEHTSQDILNLPTAETNIDLRLAPDGLGGVAWSPTATGYEVPFDHASMGATETIDLANGVVHRGTLTADCTVTVQGFTLDEYQEMRVKLAQDGTGGWAVTWDVDLVFIGDDQPEQAASEETWFVLWSDQGDTIIYALKIGADIDAETLITSETDTTLALKPDGTGGVVWGVASDVEALDDLTDVTITAPAANDTIRRVGSVFVNDARQYEAVTNGEDIWVWEGNDLVHEFTEA